RTLDALIAAGAFDSLGRNRATLSAASERVFALASRAREEIEIGQSSLFSGVPIEGGGLEGDSFPDLPEASLEERLKGEKEVLGFYVTGHPLARFAETVERFADARISDLATRADKTVRVGGVLVSLKKQKIKKGVNEGKTMLKAVLEDMSGSIPIAVFASLYEKIASWIAADLPVLVTGTVRESGPAFEMTVQDIIPLEGIKERLARSLQIRVNLALADEKLLGRLKDSLASHPGTLPVSIRLFRPGEFEATLKAADSMRVARSKLLTDEIRALTGEDSVEYVFE
ncbi:MAG TPA: OB-fold nucleic acid binding domain-containing protein, partial [Thermoanaerobaculia bacterium]|nr:OB-fold nucleic acid binding domain-containing protein [Thermoanaerobaculia bacterium]